MKTSLDDLCKEVGLRWLSKEDLIKRVMQLENDLHQQRFNNKHNLSIDQTISDKISKLETENFELKQGLEKIKKIIEND